MRARNAHYRRLSYAAAAFAASLATYGSISIRSDYPGGNVKVIGIDETNGVVRVAPDLRDTSGRWFHWNFILRGAAGRTLSFRFPDDNYEYLSSLGPAISKDGGKTWSWLRADGTRHEPANAFNYTFGERENETQFAVAIPYTQKDWNAFMGKWRGVGGVKNDVLCKSQSGKRDTELLRVPCRGKAKWLFVFTARHHACETTANPVMEGIIEELLSGSPDSDWIRSNADCAFVPFMDKDGVENGDQGKNRRPYDHNRDYLKGLYSSVKALKKLVLDESAGKRLVFIDLHSPHVRSLPVCPQQDHVFSFGSRDPHLNAHWNSFRKNWIEAQKGGTLVYDGKYEVFATDGYYAIMEKQWAAGFLSSDAWARTLPNCYMATCCEFGYSLCGGVYSFPAARELGHSLMKAVARTAQGASSLDEIAARLKPLRTWAFPYAAGVPSEAFIHRDLPPRAMPKGNAQRWTSLSVDEFFPFIDKYGQFRHKDWPGKVHSDADFAVQRKKEEKDLTDHSGPKGWDKWGGWADGPKFQKAGGFSTTKWNGKWWIVDPDGHLWWSHGPVRVSPSSAMTPLATPDGDRMGWFRELPAKDDPVFGVFYKTRDELLWPYYTRRKIDKTYDFSAANLRRKYGEKWFETWAVLAHRRLRSWGCNTIANASDRRICLMDRTPYTERFEIHARPIAGHRSVWWEFCDPFDPSFRAEARRMTEIYRAEIADPWCIGFFVDNELFWGKPYELGLSTLKSPADQPCKTVLRDRLKAKYATVARLNAAWKTAYANWDAFLSETTTPDLSGSKADLEAFSSEIAENYFRIIREELKRANPDKLYLGCRYAESAPSFTVKAAAKYCDVISYNVYGTGMSAFKLPDGVDAPVLIGEFHFGALDRGPFCPGLILLRDQKQRAQTYKNYVRTSLEHPQIVGAHWHQFSDQATSGRFDGENQQVGWTDVCDTPYWETIEAVREIGAQMYEIRSGSKH